MLTLPRLSPRLLFLATLGVGLLTTTFKAQPIFAQTTSDINSLGVAQRVDLGDPTIAPGSIITYSDSTYILSAIAYDPFIYGVTSQNPAIEFSYDDNGTTVAVLTAGKLPLRVTGVNGPIAVGDRLTSSEVPGVAMLADKSGISVAIAQESWAPSDPNQEGIVIATIDIKFTLARNLTDQKKVQSKLLDVINLSTIATLDDPKEAFRFVLAGVILLGSIIFSFLTFGRSAQNGILALGRNPLASKAISLGLVMNVIVSIVILGSGVATAWFIVSF